MMGFSNPLHPDPLAILSLPALAWRERRQAGAKRRRPDDKANETGDKRARRTLAAASKPCSGRAKPRQLWRGNGNPAGALGSGGRVSRSAQGCGAHKLRLRRQPGTERAAPTRAVAVEEAATASAAVPVAAAAAGMEGFAEDKGVGAAGGERLESAADVMAAVEAAVVDLPAAEFVPAAPARRKRGRPAKTQGVAAAARPAVRKSCRISGKVTSAAVAAPAAGEVEAGAAEGSASVAVVGRRRGRPAKRAENGSRRRNRSSSRASVDCAVQVRTALWSRGTFSAASGRLLRADCASSQLFAYCV